jgi:hypothetical protein
MREGRKERQSITRSSAGKHIKICHSERSEQSALLGPREMRFIARSKSVAGQHSTW